MAKDLSSDSNNILRTILVILIVGGIAYLVYYLYNQQKSGNKQDVVHMETSHQPPMRVPANPQIHANHSMQGGPTGLQNPIMNKESFNNTGSIEGQHNMEHFSNNEHNSKERNDSSFPKDQLTAAELLPSDNSSLWAQVNPSGEGTLKDRNFLQSGYHIGINTVGQTLRNANLQLRSEPPCPQVVISPWLQSSIEPDISRLPFEIGGCA